MYKKFTYPIYLLILVIFILTFSLYGILFCENKKIFDHNENNPVRLYLKNGKIIEGYIKDSFARGSIDYHIIFYGYDYKKMLHSDIEAKFIFKNNKEIIGKLEKIDHDLIIIKFNDFAKIIQEEYKRKDLIKIEDINDDSILGKMVIKKRDIQSCELLNAQNYYYSFSNWINPEDHVIILLRDGRQVNGKITVLTIKNMIIKINNISDIQLKWHEIKQIIITKIASHINKKKTIIRFFLAFGIFFIFIAALNSIDFEGMGY